MNTGNGWLDRTRQGPPDKLGSQAFPGRLTPWGKIASGSLGLRRRVHVVPRSEVKECAMNETRNSRPDEVAPDTASETAATSKPAVRGVDDLPDGSGNDSTGPHYGGADEDRYDAG